jgi:hypothetical protein
MRLTIVADNSTSPNWGCRATSFALRELLSRDHAIVGTIDRTLLKAPFTTKARVRPDLHATIVAKLRRERLRRLPGIGALAFGAIDFLGETHSPSHAIAADAELLWASRKTSPKANALIAQIEPCDAIVVNGEGEMIFSSPARDSLLQTLTICALARKMGKHVFWLNGMVSSAPDSAVNNETVEVARQVLGGATIAVRDSLSLDAAEELLPGMVHRWFPDALFKWSLHFAGEAALAYDSSRLTAWFDRTGTARPKCTDRPYLVLSGSSQSARDQKRAADCYTDLATRLESLGLPLLLVETCVGDIFLREVARRTGLPCLSVDAPIMAGAALLANARAFVSGRWHPGILASLGGTPGVFMGSNSHKTAALQHMLEYPNPVEYSAFPDSDTIDNIVRDTADVLAQGQELRTRIARRASRLASEVPGLLDMIR